MAFNYGTYGGTSWDERLEFVVDITMHATHDPSQNVRTRFFFHNLLRQPYTTNSNKRLVCISFYQRKFRKIAIYLFFVKTHLSKSALKNSHSRFAYKLNRGLLSMDLASNRRITSDVFNKHIVVFNTAFERSIQVRPFMSVIIRRFDYDWELKSVTRFAF